MPDVKTASFNMKHIRKGLLINLILSWFVPLILLMVLRNYSIGDTYAFAISGSIPAIRTLFVLCYKRKIDWIGLLGTVGFLASCIVSYLSGGNSLPLKIYRPLITGLTGLVLISSALIGKPLLLKVLSAIRPQEKERLNSLQAKKKLTFATILTGLFFLVDAVIHIIMAFTLSSVAYLSMSRVVTICMLVVLFGSRKLIAGRNNK